MALITAWFISGPLSPYEVLLQEPGYDRGFGRKYLAQLNPRLPVTHIADFPLNRSSAAGPGEFYIGGYDGLAVVQTMLDDITDLAEVPGRIGRGIAATDLYVIGEDPATGWAAFAHWSDGTLVRNFAADQTHPQIDEGLPVSAERPFWAGAHPPENPRPGLPLPFDPPALAHAVEAGWLGFNPRDSAPDIPVSAFAIDGRAAPRVPAPQSPPVAERAESGEYDDYETTDEYSKYDAELSNLPLISARNRIQAVTRGAMSNARKANRRVRAAGHKAWSRVNRRNR